MASTVFRICIFCGSKLGRDLAYRQAAIELGTLIAEKGYELVYGGGNVGHMGAIADACLSKGGHVIGVIPESLIHREVEGTRVGHDRLSHLEVVATMHERKARMAELSDAFIALPGGIGTLEELFEIYTWSQLKFHQKRIGLLNTGHFFDPLIQLLDHMVEENFLGTETRAELYFESSPEKLLDEVCIRKGFSINSGLATLE